MDDTHKDLAAAVEMVLPGESQTQIAICPACRSHSWEDAYQGMSTRCPECDEDVELFELELAAKLLPELLRIAEGWLREQEGVAGFIELRSDSSIVSWRRPGQPGCPETLGYGSDKDDDAAREEAATEAIVKLKGAEA